MSRHLHKLTKVFDDITMILILWRHQNATAEKIEGFQGFLLNTSKTVPTDFHQTNVILGNHL